MLKSRIILLGSAAILVILMFNLPKVVVDNDPEAVESSEPSQNESPASAPASSTHIAELSEEVLSKVKELNEKLGSSVNQEKSTIFADSLAKLYLSVDKYDSAAKFVEIIAKNNPDVNNWMRAGNAYYDAYGFAMDDVKQKFLGEKSRTYFEKVLEVEPENYQAKNKLAMTYLTTSNPMQGILMLRQILEDDPDNESALFNLGILSMQSGQYDKAVERFSNLTKLYPDNTQAIFFLGVSYLEIGDKANAREQFLLVKSLDKSLEVQASVDAYLEEIK
ncbi:MAG: tetratricopeptide repeat protein [Bacteroidota bacterium]